MPLLGIEFEDDCNDEFELDLSRYGYNVEESQGTSQNVSFFQKWQPLIWQFFEGPYLSKKAKVSNIQFHISEIFDGLYEK